MAAVERRPLIVTRHAAARAVDRGLGETVDHATGLIEAEVTAAIKAGRMQDHKTEGFVFYGRSKQPLPPGQRFCWNRDGTFGWIIAREATTDTVVTSLKRLGVRR